MKILTQKITLLFLACCMAGCGLSGDSKNQLAGLYTKAATAECSCKQMSKDDAGYTACVEGYESAVQTVETFNKQNGTSDAEKQEASMEADDIRAQCI